MENTAPTCVWSVCGVIFSHRAAACVVLHIYYLYKSAGILETPGVRTACVSVGTVCVSMGMACWRAKPPAQRCNSRGAALHHPSHSI